MRQYAYIHEKEGRSESLSSDELRFLMEAEGEEA